MSLELFFRRIEEKCEACNQTEETVIGSCATRFCEPDDSNLAVPSSVMNRMTKSWLCHRFLRRGDWSATTSVQGHHLPKASQGLLNQTVQPFVHHSMPKTTWHPRDYDATRSKFDHFRISRLLITPRSEENLLSFFTYNCERVLLDISITGKIRRRDNHERRYLELCMELLSETERW